MKDTESTTGTRDVHVTAVKEREKPCSPAAKTRARSLLIQRFQRAEIWLHWTIAAPFLICYVTALVLLVVYYQTPTLPLRDLFSWIHRISGVCLIVLPPLVMATTPGTWRLYLYNIRQGWGWAIDDVKWLMLSGLAAISSKVTLPDQGKFNAGEKLNFMMVMTTFPVFAVTGVLIWIPGVTLGAWIVHVIAAAVATPFMAGHIFMATINPSTRKGLPGMFSGRVDREWASHHYAAWYREFFGDDEDEEASEAAAAETDVAERLENPDSIRDAESDDMRS